MNTNEMQSNYLKALSHPDRLRIAKTLFETPDLCVSELQEKLGIRQANASQQLSLMTINKVLIRRRDGNRIHYSLSDKNIIKGILKTLENIDATPGPAMRG